LFSKQHSSENEKNNSAAENWKLFAYQELNNQCLCVSITKNKDK